MNNFDPRQIGTLAFLLLVAAFGLGFFFGGRNKFSEDQTIQLMQQARRDEDKKLATTTSAKKPYTSFSDGLYEVGTDIRPGTYKTDGHKDCYYARLSSFNTSDIIDNNDTDGPATVQISATDKAFISHGCGTWDIQK